MSTAAGAPTNGATPGVASPDSKNKGKAKSALSPDVSMEEDEDENDEDDEDDEMEEEAENEDEDEEEEYEEIDPSAIVGRRTRGVKVDYTSKEALEKAGLNPDEEDEEDEEMK